MLYKIVLVFVIKIKTYNTIDKILYILKQLLIEIYFKI